MEVLNFNVGVLSAGSIQYRLYLGIPLAGWGSNNKFSFYRSHAQRGAQIISYELSVGTEYY